MHSHHNFEKCQNWELSSFYRKRTTFGWDIFLHPLPNISVLQQPSEIGWIEFLLRQNITINSCSNRIVIVWINLETKKILTEVASQKLTKFSIALFWHFKIIYFPFCSGECHNKSIFFFVLFKLGISLNVCDAIQSTYNMNDRSLYSRYVISMP